MIEASKRKAFVPPTIVLLVGRDPLLLETRNLILQAAGYTVHSASLKQAFIELSGRTFDLVVLCHSVPVEDRERLTQCIRAVGLLTPVVSIMRMSGENDVFSDGMIEADPRKLLRDLGRILNR